MDEVFLDQFGNYYDSNGNQLSWYDLALRGIDVAGAALSRSPYVSPDDPRYQQRGGYGYPQQYPARTSSPDFAVSGNVDARTGVRLNTQIPTWAIALGAALGGALLFGNLLGRRR